MANNSNLGAAKAAKNDEFYTQYADILEFYPTVVPHITPPIFYTLRL